jgi:ergothioneine biosynthesis protein EgtB
VNTGRHALSQRFLRVRALTTSLCEGLRPEDYRSQPEPEVSPPWWSLGHTSWFFARNLLQPAGRYRGEWQRFEYPLNSYYEGLGPRLPRHRRGAVTRPGTEEMLAYRGEVDDGVLDFLLKASEPEFQRLQPVLEIGIQHEQQHQELFLTEILAIRGADPEQLRAPYREAGRDPAARTAQPLRWTPCKGGLVAIGHRGAGFAWDNEQPEHRVFLADFEFGNRLVTCGDWLAFLADGGYRQPLLWLSNGWNQVQEQRIAAPRYWQQRSGSWSEWTLLGERPIDPAAPVCHVSFYEATAFAQWCSAQGGELRGARLPTEAEWEHAARSHGFDAARGNLLDDPPAWERLVPQAAEGRGDGIVQLAGDVWEWTTSHYEAFPGYRPFDGALTEYNGKFMDNQRVLRGGSLATPRDHVRASYRNFWPAWTRFQFSGVRLCRDLT